MSPQAKKILIVGATGGIGTSIAQSLSNDKVHLVLHGTDSIKLKLLVNEIIQKGATVSSYQGDLATESSTRLFCNQLTVEADTSFDWLIYCAGYIDETEPQGFISASNTAKTFNINVLAAQAIIQTFEAIISNQGGVIFISSTAGLWGNGEYPVYAASKAALNNFGKSLAKRWKDSRKAITICPGPTNTAMREKIARDASTHQSPEKVAGLVSEIVSGKRLFSNGTMLQVRNNEVIIIPD